MSPIPVAVPCPPRTKGGSHVAIGTPRLLRGPLIRNGRGRPFSAIRRAAPGPVLLARLGPWPAPERQAPPRPGAAGPGRAASGSERRRQQREASQAALTDDHERHGSSAGRRLPPFDRSAVKDARIRLIRERIGRDARASPSGIDRPRPGAGRKGAFGVADAMAQAPPLPPPPGRGGRPGRGDGGGVGTNGGGPKRSPLGRLWAVWAVAGPPETAHQRETTLTNDEVSSLVSAAFEAQVRRPTWSPRRSCQSAR